MRRAQWPSKPLSSYRFPSLSFTCCMRTVNQTMSCACPSLLQRVTNSPWELPQTLLRPATIQDTPRPPLTSHKTFAALAHGYACADFRENAARLRMRKFARYAGRSIYAALTSTFFFFFFFFIKPKLFKIKNKLKSKLKKKLTSTCVSPARNAHTWTAHSHQLSCCGVDAVCR